MIAEHPRLSLREQCGLLGLHRSGLYYEPVSESAENLLLMNLLDRQYTAHPEQGVRRIAVVAQWRKGLTRIPVPYTHAVESSGATTKVLSTFELTPGEEVPEDHGPGGIAHR